MGHGSHDPQQIRFTHEMGTALTIILGHAQLLQQHARTADPLDRTLVLRRATTISDHCRRLADLVAQLREEWGMPPDRPREDT